MECQSIFSGKNSLEIISIECQSLFAGKNKTKHFRMLSAEIFTQHASYGKELRNPNI